MFEFPLHETAFLFLCGAVTAAASHRAGVVGLLAARFITPVLLGVYLAACLIEGGVVYLDEGLFQVAALPVVANTVLLPGGVLMATACHLRHRRRRRANTH